MAISAQLIRDHIEFHSSRLAGTRYPFTAKWPQRIFRHDPLENIGQILNAGQLLSRTDSAGIRSRDTADFDIVNNSDRAHDSVRMYFRPRTPTQYRIEGIKKTTDPWGHVHAPMLGMMIFKAASIFAMEGVKFSTCNMQRNDVEVGDTDQFFIEKLDFARIFHYGWHDEGEAITAKRCAEVLTPSPLQLQDNLEYIYCRSEAEFETLLSYLNADTRKKWQSRIRISDDLKVFEKRYTYVEQAFLSNDGLIAQFSPRPDTQAVTVKATVKDANSNQEVVAFGPAPLSPRPPNDGLRWIFEGKLYPGIFLVEIELESCTAYRAFLPYDEIPF